jgi:AraC-like DNA-binding protein
VISKVQPFSPPRTQAVAAVDSMNTLSVTFSEQIRILIRKNIEIHKVDAEAVTQFMPFEKRTMQRRLREEGTSYRSLLNEVRVELAKDWLSNSDIPITRLVERLHYSGLATMTRAFKTQAGLTPKAWRSKTRTLHSN